MSGRLEREREFHNKAFSDDTRQLAGRFYAVTERSRRAFMAELVRKGTRGRALELGCGPLSYAFFLGEQGADVTGIDISDAAVALARQAGAARSFAGRVSFERMNAESLNFADETFDLICGTGILHHLELKQAFAEIRRTLKPDGVAIFIEPMDHNPLIRLFRALTPSMRTPDEHPLTMADMETASLYFGRVEPTFLDMTSLASVAFRRTPFFARLLPRLEALDDALFAAVPALRKYAWRVSLKLSDPRKEVAPVRRRNAARPGPNPFSQPRLPPAPLPPAELEL